MLTGEFPSQPHIRSQLHGCSLKPAGDSVLLPFIALSFTFNINYATRVSRDSDNEHAIASRHIKVAAS